jgi:hypothetical protein
MMKREKYVNLLKLLTAGLLTCATQADSQGQVSTEGLIAAEQRSPNIPPSLPSSPWGEAQFIHLINDAMTNYTPRVISHFIFQPVVYFGKVCTYSQIEKDILSDSETYDINECIYKESTFQHLAIGPDLFRDSIEVYNYARERRNHRLHRGHCLIILEYRYRGTSPSISSIQLKVLPGGL